MDARIGRRARLMTTKDENGNTITQPEHEAIFKRALDMLEEGHNPLLVIVWLRREYEKITRVFA